MELLFIIIIGILGFLCILPFIKNFEEKMNNNNNNNNNNVNNKNVFLIEKNSIFVKSDIYDFFTNDEFFKDRYSTINRIDGKYKRERLFFKEMFMDIEFTYDTPERNVMLEKIIDFKRKGMYKEAIDESIKYKHNYIIVSHNFYVAVAKVLACNMEFEASKFVFELARGMYKTLYGEDDFISIDHINELGFEWKRTSNFESNAKNFESYIRGLSGNPNYKFPEPLIKIR